MRKKFLFSSTIVLTTIFGLTLAASAANIVDQMKGGVSEFALPGAAKPGDAEALIGTVIQSFLSILGIIFLGLMLYGGYKWMSAQGREQEVSKAKDIIRSAIIGLIVIFAAYAISVFVISSLASNVGSADSTKTTCPAGSTLDPDSGDCMPNEF